MSIKVAPSILSADFLNLQESLDSISNADMVHIDIMDAHFVDNLSFGPLVAEPVIKNTILETDCHLMIDDPDKWAIEYAKMGANLVTIHYGTTDNYEEIAKKIHSNNAKAGISIKPDEGIDKIKSIMHFFDVVLIMSVEPGKGGQQFIPKSLDKIKELKEYIDSNNLKIEIEVDGGVTLDNIVKIYQAGANTVVAGTTVFGSSNPPLIIEQLKSLTAK